MHYIGKGKGQRFGEHKKDMLAKTIDSSWTCEIVAWGLTDLEAHILEAKLIKIAVQERNLSPIGVYV